MGSGFPVPGAVGVLACAVGPLGLVHGHVRVGDQVVADRLARPGVGDPDAGGDLCPTSEDLEGSVEGVGDPRGQLVIVAGWRSLLGPAPHLSQISTIPWDVMPEQCPRWAPLLGGALLADPCRCMANPGGQVGSHRRSDAPLTGGQGEMT